MSHENAEVVEFATHCVANPGWTHIRLGRQLVRITYKLNQWGTVRHGQRTGKSNVHFLHIANWARDASTQQKEFMEQLEEEKRLNEAVLESLGKVKI
jgi:hypothetical protein